MCRHKEKFAIVTHKILTKSNDVWSIIALFLLLPKCFIIQSLECIELTLLIMEADLKSSMTQASVDVNCRWQNHKHGHFQCQSRSKYWHGCQMKFNISFNVVQIQTPIFLCLVSRWMYPRDSDNSWIARHSSWHEGDMYIEITTTQSHH